MIPFKLRPTHKAGTRILPLALVLSLLFTGCNGDILPSDSKWIDSNIEGAVDTSAEYRLQDDFAAAIMKEIILDENTPDTPLKDVHDLSLQRKRELLEDTSIRNKGLDEVRKYAALAEDLDLRKSQGIEPLKKYLEKIESIGSIDDLYRWICSTEDNPLAIAPLLMKKVVHSPADPTAYTTYLSFPELTFGDNTETYYNLDNNALDKIECTRDQIGFILKEAGYDSSAAGRIVDENFRMEKTIASKQGTLTSNDFRDLSYSRSDLEQAAESYPLPSLFLFPAGGLAKYTSDTLNTERAVIRFAVPAIVSLNVYLSVFGDELKTGAIQCIIGRGISRTRVVMTKFLECLILSGILFAVVELVYFVRNIVFNVGASPLQSDRLPGDCILLCLPDMEYSARNHRACRALIIHRIDSQPDRDPPEGSGLPVLLRRPSRRSLRGDFCRKCRLSDHSRSTYLYRRCASSCNCCFQEKGDRVLINIIRADFRRIIQKKLLWIMMAVPLIINTAVLFYYYFKDELTGFRFLTYFGNDSMVLVLVGSVILLSVYGDELRSMAMTTLIGRGYSLTKIILAKFIDVVLLVIAVNIFYAVIALVLMLVFRVPLTGFETKILTFRYLMNIYDMIGNITFAAFFIFSWRIPRLACSSSLRHPC